MAGPTIDLSKSSVRAKFAAMLENNPAQAQALFDNTIEQILNGSMFPLKRKKEEKEARTERDSQIVIWACAALNIKNLTADQYEEAVELIKAVTFNPRFDYMSSLKSYGGTQSPAWQLYAHFDSHYEMIMPEGAEKNRHFIGLLRAFAHNQLQQPDAENSSGVLRYVMRSVLNMCNRGLYKGEKNSADVSRLYADLLLEFAERDFAQVWDNCAGTIFSHRLEENTQKALVNMVLEKFDPAIGKSIAEYILERSVLSEPMRVKVCERLVADGSPASMDAAVMILVLFGLQEAPKKILFDFLAQVPQEEAVRLRPMIERYKGWNGGREEHYEDRRAHATDPHTINQLDELYTKRIFLTPERELNIEKLSLEDRYKFAEMTKEIYKVQPTRAFAVAARLLGTDFEKPRFTDAQYKTLYDVLLKTYNEYACHDNVDANARSAVVGTICSLIIHEKAPIALVRRFAEAVGDAGMRGISPAVVFYTANKIAQKTEIPMPRRVMMVEVLQNLLQHDDAEIRSAAEAGRAQVAAEQLGLAHSSLLPENFFGEGGGQQLLLAKLAPSKFELPLIEMPKPAPQEEQTPAPQEPKLHPGAF